MTLEEIEAERRMALALEDFKRATLLLDEAWHDRRGDALVGYPPYLPSFDEFNHDVQGMTLRSFE